MADVLALYEGICSDTLRRMISFERSEEFNAWLLPLKDELGRESLYKALPPGAKPRYDTMLKLLHALGVKLSASPIHS